MTKDQMIEKLVNLVQEKRPSQRVERKELQRKNKKYIQSEIERYSGMEYKKRFAAGSAYLAEAKANM
jgi:hypothetical protein